MRKRRKIIPAAAIPTTARPPTTPPTIAPTGVLDPLPVWVGEEVPEVLEPVWEPVLVELVVLVLLLPLPPAEVLETVATSLGKVAPPANVA